MPRDYFETINNKEFLAKTSLKSSANIHTKLYPTGEYQIRINDCNGGAKIWGNLFDEVDREEFIEKIDTLISHLTEFRKKAIKQINQTSNNQISV